MSKVYQYRTIKESEIEKEETVCPYCGDQKKHFTCCGENHFEKAYHLKNGDVLLESEVYVQEDFI